MAAFLGSEVQGGGLFVAGKEYQSSIDIPIDLPSLFLSLYVF